MGLYGHTLLAEPEILDKEIAERSLVEFTREFWHYIDPVPFRTNWHIEAIGEHLEAVSRGEIRRLLINIPPRHCKSSLVSVMWPAWTWVQPKLSPISGPHVRFMYSSYAQSLSIRDSVNCRRVIESPLYQERWHQRFKMTTDVNTKTRFENNKNGYRIATSVDGALTGEGGIALCFPGDEIVWTEHGPKRFDAIVQNRQRLRVWSTNLATGHLELKPITEWYKNPGSPIVRVTLSDGSDFRCTPSHKVWTQRGWVEAQGLLRTDVLPTPTVSDSGNSAMGNAVLPAESAITQIGRPNGSNDCVRQLGIGVLSSTPIIIGSSEAVGTSAPVFATSDISNHADADAITICKDRRYFSADSNLLDHVGSEFAARITCAITSQSQTIRNASPIYTTANISDGSCANTILFCKDRDCFATHCNGSCRVLGEFGAWTSFKKRKRSMSFGVTNIIGTSAIYEVRESVLGRIPVQMSDFLPIAGRSDERQHHRLMDMHSNACSVTTSIESGIPFVGRRAQDAAGYFHGLAFSQRCARQTSHTSKVGDCIFRKTRNRSPILVEYIGHADTTYCLTVADNHNLIVGHSSDWHPSEELRG